MHRLAIRASGMVSAVGMTASASCAAIRAGISRIQELPFVIDGTPLFGAMVGVDARDLREKLLVMLSLAIGECLLEEDHGVDLPVILCVPEPDRPGAQNELDRRFLTALRVRLGLEPALVGSGVLSLGRVGGVQGVEEARKLIASGREMCIVAGVDSLLSAETLTAYHHIGRLKTDDDPDGFSPGEAAAAVLLGPQTREEGELLCLGTGHGDEPAPIGSEEPLRAEGLFQAIRSAFKEGDCSYNDVDYRITDLTGEHYGFKEAALALTRTLRERRPRFEMWHPCESVGEVGAATVPLVLGVALAASRRGYAPGSGVLCHFSGDGRERAAMVLRRS